MEARDAARKLLAQNARERCGLGFCQAEEGDAICAGYDGDFAGAGHVCVGAGVEDGAVWREDREWMLAGWV